MVLIAAGHPRPDQIFSKVLNSAIIPKQRFAIGFGLPSGKRVSSPFCRMNRLTPCSVSCSMIDRKSSWRGGYIHRSRPYLYAFCGTLAAKMNLVKSPIGSVSGRVFPNRRDHRTRHGQRTLDYSLQTLEVHPG